MNQQRVIPIPGKDEFTFESFHVGPNAFLLEELCEAAKGENNSRVLFLWGKAGSGKTHLLNACCKVAKRNNRSYHYLAVGDGGLIKLSKKAPKNSLICLDNSHFLSGNAERQLAAMTLYEQVTANNGNIIIAANTPLIQANIQLADLVSRFLSGGTYHLKRLDEETTRVALQQRAHQRGFELNCQVMDFIMNHYTRDTRTLFALLDRIDIASLQYQRKITVPFIRTLIQSGQ